MEMGVSPRLVGIDYDPRVAARIFGQQRRKAVAQFPRDIGRGAVVDVEEGRHPGAYLILPGEGVEPTRKRVSSEPSPSPSWPGVLAIALCQTLHAVGFTRDRECCLGECDQTSLFS